MKAYDVTILATVTKTLRIEAENEDAASEMAHGDFTVACEGGDERYTEETLDITEVE